MLKCALCDHPAEFQVSYGAEDQVILVCRWCTQDLQLLGLQINQVVRLFAKPSFLPVLGPVGRLLEAAACMA